MLFSPYIFYFLFFISFSEGRNAMIFTQSNTQSKIITSLYILLYASHIAYCSPTPEKNTLPVGETRDQTTVFHKWTTPEHKLFQRVYSNINLTSMIKNFNPDYVTLMQERYKQNKSKLKPAISFLNSLTGWHLYDKNYDKNFTLTPQAQDRFKKLYELSETNIPAFIDFLIEHNFISHFIDHDEKSIGIRETVEKYKACNTLLFGNKDELTEQKQLFSLADRFFTYCFSPKTHDHFKKLSRISTYKPITRYVYTTLWHNFAGRGWKMWSQDVINDLKEKVKAGKTIVYIAGGGDIYQLITHGVYKLKILDPLVPETQLVYYPEGWQWLIKGNGEHNGIGDILVLTPKDKTIVLKREKFTPHGTSFDVTLSNNKKINIPASTTRWGIYERKESNGKHNDTRVGTCEFERRLSNQDDFNKTSTKEVVLSFNELSYVTRTKAMGGWGIDLDKLDDDFSMYIKQLTKPVSKAMLKNMHQATKQNVCLINLGSCIGVK